jgi:hypothetical protein
MSDQNTTYEAALKAGRQGSADEPAKLAVVIENFSAEKGLETGNIPYLFPPKPVWEAARAKSISAGQAWSLFVTYGPDASASILARD